MNLEIYVNGDGTNRDSENPDNVVGFNYYCKQHGGHVKINIARPNKEFKDIYNKNLGFDDVVDVIHHVSMSEFLCLKTAKTNKGIKPIKRGGCTVLSRTALCVKHRLAMDIFGTRCPCEKIAMVLNKEVIKGDLLK